MELVFLDPQASSIIYAFLSIVMEKQMKAIKLFNFLRRRFNRSWHERSISFCEVNEKERQSSNIEWSMIRMI